MAPIATGDVQGIADQADVRLVAVVPKGLVRSGMSHEDLWTCVKEGAPLALFSRKARGKRWHVDCKLRVLDLVRRNLPREDDPW